MTAAQPVATWYPGKTRVHGTDVWLLGYNTDRKIHVRRVDNHRDFFVWPRDLGGMTGGLAALNEAFARLPYIPRRGGSDPGPPQLGASPISAPKPAPHAGGATPPSDDTLIDGGLL